MEFLGETLNDDICQLQKKSYNLNKLVVRREREIFCAATMTIANLFKLAHVYKQTTLRIFPCPLKKSHIKIIYIVKFILHFLMQSLCI